MAGDRRYHVKNIGGGSWEIHHSNAVIANIERIQDYPEFYKTIFGKVVPNHGRKYNTRYMVTNLAGATNDKFRTIKGASHHAAFHHLNNANMMRDHPAILIGYHIDNLGKTIHAAAADPRMTDHDQIKLLQVSKQHAVLREIHETHFPKP